MRLPALLVLAGLLAGCAELPATSPGPLAPSPATQATGDGAPAGSWDVQLMRHDDEPAFVAHNASFRLHAEAFPDGPGQVLRATWDGALPPGTYTVRVAAQDARGGPVALNATLQQGSAQQECPGQGASAVPGSCAFTVRLAEPLPDAPGADIVLFARGPFGNTTRLAVDAGAP